MRVHPVSNGLILETFKETGTIQDYELIVHTWGYIYFDEKKHDSGKKVFFFFPKIHSKWHDSFLM